MSRDDELESLHLAILESPADDAPRLIYADWLQEYGDATAQLRAEFVRTQIELARMTKPWCKTESRENNCEELGYSLSSSCDWCALRRRELTLWEARDAEGEYVMVAGPWPAVAGNFGWQQTVPQNAISSSRTTPQRVWRRGFPDEVKAPLDVLLDHGAEILRHHPVTAFIVTDRRPARISLEAANGYCYWEPGIKYEAMFRIPFSIGELLGVQASFIMGGLMVYRFRSETPALDALDGAVLKFCLAQLRELVSQSPPRG